MTKPAGLSFTKQLDVRFSEVDAMQIVWHGSYALSYHTIAAAGCYAPLVDLEFHYRRPIVYGERPLITITYIPTEAAKLIFEYVIHSATDGEVIATGRSVQVFLDSNRNLLWTAPEFFEKWKAATLTQE